MTSAIMRSPSCVSTILPHPLRNEKQEKKYQIKLALLDAVLVWDTYGLSDEFPYAWYDTRFDPPRQVEPKWWASPIAVYRAVLKYRREYK